MTNENKLMAVDAQFNCSAQGLVEGLKRVGTVAEDARVSFDETVAYITALKEVTGRSEAVLGNSLKTIFTNVRKSDESVTNRLRQLSEDFNNLNDEQKSEIAKLFAGNFQRNSFLGLMKAFSSGKFDEVYNFVKALK